MYRTALTAVALAIALLWLTPSTTPYSPHNPGPDGLTQLAQMCRQADDADIIILAPGAAYLNVTAATTKIVDPYINFGDPHIPAAADTRGAALAAPNATPLIGRGKPLIRTSPTSFSDTSHGPYALALALEEENKTIYHASLFTNYALRWNHNYAKQICARPIKIVVPDGDLAHIFHQHLDEAQHWAAPAILTATSLYLVLKKTTWPTRREK